MREIVHIQAGQCGNQIGAKVRILKTEMNKAYIWEWINNALNHLLLLETKSYILGYVYFKLKCSTLPKW